MSKGPATITREWGQRRIRFNAMSRPGRGQLRGRGRGQERPSKWSCPPGRYSHSSGAAIRDLEAGAVTRLLIVVPVALLLIFGLLYFTYDLRDVLLVFPAVPFACVGGVLACGCGPALLDLGGGRLHRPVGRVGLEQHGAGDVHPPVAARRAPDGAIEEAALTRLRPVLMTALVASLGFVPMALSTGMGAEVQRPLATVVIGGVISTLLMSLLVIRVLYIVFDTLVHAAEWALTHWLGLQPASLTWLFGDHGSAAVTGEPAA